MENSSDSYQKVLDLLKRSRPQPGHPQIMEEKIMQSIKMHNAGMTLTPSGPGGLFGWTRIVWVRRAFSAAAVLMLVFLAYQQSIIIRQISVLNQQLVPGNPGKPSSGTAGSMELLLYRLSAGRDQEISSEISGDRVVELIESAGMMSEKYRDLLQMINEDPDLKKLIEQKLEKKLENKTPEKTKL